MDKKEVFTKLLNAKGYKSIYEFCESNGIDRHNMSKRLSPTETRQRIEVGFMFKIANLLHVPIETIIEIFYPEEFKENRSLIEK